MRTEVALHVERLGEEGHPIVMLHGWGRTLDALRPLGECLSREAQVHLVDLPGFGQSGAPDGVWDAFRYADRIVAHLDAHGIDTVDLIGHSFGGKVSVALASRYPHRVRRLVLLASSGLKRRRTWVSQCRLTGIRWMGKAVKAFDRVFRTQWHASRFSARYGSADYKAAGAMRPVLVKSVNEDYSEVLWSVKTPTLLLWGDKDTETPPEVAIRFHKLIPSSKLYIFPGKDHDLFRDGGSHVCASYILPFLRGGNKRV